MHCERPQKAINLLRSDLHKSILFFIIGGAYLCVLSVPVDLSAHSLCVRDLLLVGFCDEIRAEQYWVWNARNARRFDDESNRVWFGTVCSLGPHPFTHCSASANFQGIISQCGSHSD